MMGLGNTGSSQSGSSESRPIKVRATPPLFCYRCGLSLEERAMYTYNGKSFCGSICRKKEISDELMKKMESKSA